jgi:hypothetical protein
MTILDSSKTSCMGTGTAETLVKLHEQQMRASKNVYEYLMDAMEYLKTEDLSGWKARFQPTPPEAPMPVKRLRQSPVRAAFHPQHPCAGCKSEEVIDDVHEGQIVCLHCGLIQQLGVFWGGIAHCSYDQMSNLARVAIHRYSRVIHFMTVIRLGEGNSRPIVDTETLLLMQVDLVGENVDDCNVRKMLRRLGLSRRYRRHAAFFADKFGGERQREVPGTVVYAMAKMFRTLEFFHEKKHKRIWPNGRKAFFSYKFILYQFLHELGYESYTGQHHLLKSVKLLNVQREAYRIASRYTGFTLYD